MFQLLPSLVVYWHFFVSALRFSSELSFRKFQKCDSFLFQDQSRTKMWKMDTTIEEVKREREKEGI